MTLITKYSTASLYETRLDMIYCLELDVIDETLEYYAITLTEEQWQSIKFEITWGSVRYNVDDLKSLKPEVSLYQLDYAYGPFAKVSSFPAVNIDRIKEKINIIQNKKSTQKFDDNILLFGYSFTMAQQGMRHADGKVASQIYLKYIVETDELQILTIFNDVRNQNMLEDIDDPHLTSENISIALEYIREWLKYRLGVWVNEKELV